MIRSSDYEIGQMKYPIRVWHRRQHLQWYTRLHIVVRVGRYVVHQQMTKIEEQWGGSRRRKKYI